MRIKIRKQRKLTKKQLKKRKKKSPALTHVSLPIEYSFYILFLPLGDVEIQVLKARLEQTEAALERIVAHMGAVTARLARNGVFMDEEVGSTVSGSVSL